jgi:hypothetical protein
MLAGTEGGAMVYSRVAIVLLAIATCILGHAALSYGSSLQSEKSAPSDQRRTLRVGIALMSNRSGRQASPSWERDQLVRELERKRTDRKSSVILEVISLQASSREDARAEAAQKNCEYLVLTTMVDPARGPAISGGPDGVTPAPVIVGNAKASQILAIDFVILEVGDVRTLAEGTSTATVEDNNDTRAADEAMRLTAHRVATELRKDRPANID